MTFTNLDSICRNTLLKRGYPMHYYLQFLVYAAAGLRELSMDSIAVINTKLIPVDQNTNEADLPNDYMDFIEVGVPVGQKIKPLVRGNTLNSLPSYTSNFTQQEYFQRDSSGNNLYYYPFPLYWNTVVWNSYGENIGRLFGWGAGNPSDTFAVIPERNVIKINEGMSATNIVLQYISDGTSADAATQITPYAFDTIYKYIIWQHKENNRTYSEGERMRAKMEFKDAHGVLRARVNGITLDEVKRIAQDKFTQASRY